MPALINKMMNVQPISSYESIPPSMLCAIENKVEACQRYSNLNGQKVEECGCFIDGILVASLHAYIPELDHLLEIKG